MDEKFDYVWGFIISIAVLMAIVIASEFEASHLKDEIKEKDAIINNLVNKSQECTDEDDDEYDYDYDYDEED